MLPGISQDRTRTGDMLIINQLLYPLSYPAYRGANVKADFGSTDNYDPYSNAIRLPDIAPPTDTLVPSVTASYLSRMFTGHHVQTPIYRCSYGGFSKGPALTASAPPRVRLM